MKRIGVASFVLVMGMALPAAAQFDGSSPQGPLNTAKDLYASARYDEALSVLNGLRIGESVDRKSVEQYRSLCLLALGRSGEAENAIAAVVTADPTYQPGESEASPRVRATFTDVRKRLLPQIATTRYQTAKASYDRKEWPAAEEQFKLVLSLIDDPDTGGRLADLRVLTMGFLELSARAAAPPPPPPPAPAPAPEPAPAPAAKVTAAPVAPAPAAVPARPVAGKIYTADDPMISPPTVVKQQIPAVPANVAAMARTRGLLDIVIDQEGRVINMTIRASIHPNYDKQLLVAARDWKYKPATFNGEPVPFRKLIQVAVNK
jgi:hypothetical protein